MHAGFQRSARIAKFFIHRGARGIVGGGTMRLLGGILTLSVFVSGLGLAAVALGSGKWVIRRGNV
jgi:hypothetical protein